MSAINLFGPNSANASSTRPANDTKTTSTDLWFKDASSANAYDGTVLDASFLNTLVAQLRAIVTLSGATPTGDDLTNDNFLATCIQALGASGISTAGLVTTSALTTALMSYATQAWVNQAIAASAAGLVTPAELSAALGAYVTTASLSSGLAGYVTAAALTQALANYATTASLGAYLTTVAAGQTYAPLNNPGLTGGTTSTTPAKFSANTQLVNTEYVASMLGNNQVEVITGGATVTEAQAGTLFFCEGAGSYSIELPAMAGLSSGATYTFVNISGGPITLTPTGADNFVVGDGYVTNFSIPVGRSVSAANVGSWLVWGTAADAVAERFVASIATNGFRQNADGTIDVWGQIPIVFGTGGSITLPLTLPNNILNAELQILFSSVSSYICRLGSWTNSSLSFFWDKWGNEANGATATLLYRVLGN